MNLRNEVEYFNKKSRAYRAEYDLETAEGYSFRVRREKVAELTPNGSTVIDIASGPGVMVTALREKGCTITCVDAAPEMIARAKEEFPDVEAVVGDAYDLKFPDGSFDITLSMGLIEYLEDEKRYLQETYRILKPGGYLIITFPNYTSPWRAIGRILLFLVRLFRGPAEGNVTHREYTVAGAKSLLKKNGFEAEILWHYNFKIIPYPLDRWFPRLTVRQSRLFEHLDRSPLKFIGTGFILKARKN